MLKYFRKDRKKRKGFTLIELMIVIAIIGVLAAIAVPNFTAARRKARAKACIANMKLLENALQQYDMDVPPTTGTTSVPGTGEDISGYKLVKNGYVQKDPVCPVTQQSTTYTVHRGGSDSGYALYVECSVHKTISYAMKAFNK